jgi:hypothetical protein
MKRIDFSRDVAPFLIATLGEFIALFYWLKFKDLNKGLDSVLILWAGFIVERVAVLRWARTIYREAANQPVEPDRPWWLQALAVAGAILVEVLIWSLWLYAADRAGWLIGGLALLIAMQVLHGVEMASLKQTKLFMYVGNPRTLLFTLMEVFGAILWLHFVRASQPIWGGTALLIGLSVEHVVQGIMLKPEEPVTPNS